MRNVVWDREELNTPRPAAGSGMPEGCRRVMTSYKSSKEISKVVKTGLSRVGQQGGWGRRLA